MKKKRYFMHSTISKLPKGHKYRGDIARSMRADRRARDAARKSGYKGRWK
ncbi:MAG: hypothetical protein [Microvirus sp.]|nr:MAG: hypothetical protein [Microvirus sp.]